MTRLFTFLYSRREGTRAAKLPDVVPPEEKSRWFQELLKVQGRIGMRKYQSYVGRTEKVLLDSISRQEGCLLAVQRVTPLWRQRLRRSFWASLSPSGWKRR